MTDLIIWQELRLEKNINVVKGMLLLRYVFPKNINLPMPIPTNKITNQYTNTKTDTKKEIWCVVGNIIEKKSYRVGEIEAKSGTKHFNSGAKVYIIDGYWGMAERIIIIGQHRKSHRFIKIVTDLRWVENLRVKLIYSPSVILIAQKHFSNRGIFDKEQAESMLKAILKLQKG